MGVHGNRDAHRGAPGFPSLDAKPQRGLMFAGRESGQPKDFPKTARRSSSSVPILWAIHLDDRRVKSSIPLSRKQKWDDVEVVPTNPPIAPQILSHPSGTRLHHNFPSEKRSVPD